MSDQNISEKIVENLSNFIKKTNVFETTERIQGIFIGLTLCTSVFGLFTIYNTYNSLKTEEKLNNIEKLVKENAIVPRIYYKILLDCQNNVYNMTRKQINNEKLFQNMYEKLDTIIGLIEYDKKEHEKINK